MQEEIVADGAEKELRFQSLVEWPKASFEWKRDVPSTRFPFWPDVDLRVIKSYNILTACEDAPNVQVSLKTIHALVDVGRGAERGGAEVNPESQQRL